MANTRQEEGSVGSHAMGPKILAFQNTVFPVGDGTYPGSTLLARSFAHSRLRRRARLARAVHRAAVCIRLYKLMTVTTAGVPKSTWKTVQKNLLQHLAAHLPHSKPFISRRAALPVQADCTLCTNAVAQHLPRRLARGRKINNPNKAVSGV